MCPTPGQRCAACRGTIECCGTLWVGRESGGMHHPLTQVAQLQLASKKRYPVNLQTSAKYSKQCNVQQSLNARSSLPLKKCQRQMCWKQLRPTDTTKCFLQRNQPEVVQNLGGPCGQHQELETHGHRYGQTTGSGSACSAVKMPTG